MVVPGTSERTRTRTLLGGCVALALLLRAPYLATPLGVDEGGLAWIANGWSGGRGSLYGPYWLDRPPLLVGLFRLAAPAGALGVRALGALAAVALVLVVSALGREVAGRRAGLLAGLLTALLSSSVALNAVYTPAELLAVVPSTLSVLCLLLAHRRREARFVVAAGAAAVAATLVKQSFLDAGVAGVVFVLASAHGDRGVRVRWPLAYLTGALAPLTPLIAWQAAVSGPDGLPYALFGFRIDALRTLDASSIPLASRATQLVLPLLASGLAVALGGAAAGLWRTRRDRVLVLVLAAWIAGATAGVVAGGSYWSHYLIALVPASAVLAGVALSAAPRRLRVGTLAAGVGLAVAIAAGGLVWLDDRGFRGDEVAVGHYVRDHARPGDTQYVLYARANVAYYTGLPSPYPYAWSLMVRAVPGAPTRLQRLLASPRRPTWVVAWQPPARWGLDPHGTTRALIRRYYRRVATVRRHPVLVRRDRRIAPGQGRVS